MTKRQLIVSKDLSGKRFDDICHELFPVMSRSAIQKLIEQKRISVGDKPQKAGYKPKVGEIISSDFTESELSEVPAISLPIIYEDEDCIVIDKPAGVLTHSKGVFNPEATVASFIAPKLHDLSGERGGIVHRLDRPTSGVILCAKHKQSLDWFQKQFSERRVTKEYVAIVKSGLPQAEAVIDAHIRRNVQKPKQFMVSSEGKSAQTHYKVTKTTETYSQLLLRPKTGRTHQLRVHLSYIGYPIVGDTLYGGELSDRLYLHAYKLAVKMPGGITKTFTSDIPAQFKDKLG